MKVIVTAPRGKMGKLITQVAASRDDMEPQGADDRHQAYFQCQSLTEYSGNDAWHMHCETGYRQFLNGR